MEQKILLVNGMHCNACKTLVSMELEEKGLMNKIADISVDEEKQLGTVSLKDATDQDTENIIKVIESVGDYNVKEK